MKTNWTFDTHGDPLGAVRRLVHALWRELKLDGMLVPLSGPHQSAKATVLDDPSELGKFNPFRPLMTLNDAKYIPALLRERPHHRLGAVLRPCEMRALTEMVRRGAVESGPHLTSGPLLTSGALLTISVDCLGTFPETDFGWRAQRKGSTDRLDSEGLQFARQGGILAYRFRPACQTCLAPDAHGADVNLGVLGLPVRQYILVSARDEQTSERLGLRRLTDGEAGPDLIVQRERMLARLKERNRHTRERILNGLASVLPADLATLVTQFEACDDCQQCMSVCPICEIHFPQRGPDGRYLRTELMDWIASCAGCGMCEQVCPNHQPLGAIFTNLRQRAAEAALLV